MTRVLVVASTFPASETDSVPAFVRDQVIAMKQVDSSLKFDVLAPHDTRSNTVSFTHYETYDEHRFHYAWPYRVEKLAGRGIMPALQANPLNYLLIPFLFVGECFALFRLAKRTKPDVIYAHWFTPQAITAGLVSKMTKTPLVFTTHAADVQVWKKIPIIGALVVRFVTRRTQRFTAVSNRSMQKLASFFSEPEWERLKPRARVIPMGVELPAHNHNTLEGNDILFIGRLAEKKGVQYLLPAFQKLLKSQPDSHLTIAGDGPWRERLERQAEDLELSTHVTFAGYTTGAKKQKLLEQHALYVVPSIITKSGDAEGMPVSLMEGLATGRICIATNESGADAVIEDGVDGFLVSERDSDALHDALLRGLSLTQSERSNVSSQAVTTAEQFAWPTIAQQHIDFLLNDIA